jgi:hypothetical protein
VSLGALRLGPRGSGAGAPPLFFEAVGAFEFATSGRARIGASGTVHDVGAGAESRAQRRTLTTDGFEAACEKATGEDSCVAGVCQPGGDSCGTGGMGGGTTSEGGGGAAIGGAGSGTGGGDGASRSENGGCSCVTAGGTVHSRAWCLSLAAAWLARRRRKRRKQPG